MLADMFVSTMAKAVKQAYRCLFLVNAKVQLNALTAIYSTAINLTAVYKHLYMLYLK